MRSFHKILSPLSIVASGYSTHAQQPNIILILSDDQAYNTIHAWGNTIVHTPNLDRLVKTGTSFRQACVMGGKQGAICAPSRAMIMTRAQIVLPFRRCRRNPRNDATLPMLLRQHGYYTFATGKWHNSRNSLHHSFDSISNIFLGGMHTVKAGGHHQPVLFNYDPSGQYPSSAAWQGNKFASGYFGDAATNFIRTHKSKQPFFCYVAFSSPHDPRTPPEKFSNIYDPERSRCRPISFPNILSITANC